MDPATRINQASCVYNGFQAALASAQQMVPLITYYSEENNQKSRAFYQAFISKVKQRFKAERNEDKK